MRLNDGIICYAIVSVFYNVERCSLSALWKIAVKALHLVKSHINRLTK